MDSICVTTSGEDATKLHKAFIDGLQEIYGDRAGHRCRKAFDLYNATLTIWDDFRWLMVVSPYVTGKVMQWGVDWRSEVEVENHEGLVTDFDGEVFDDPFQAISYAKALRQRLADVAVD